MSYSYLIELYVTVESKAEAKEIADDIHEILNDSGVTNSLIVTDEFSE